jgi:ABC-2 type transport system permease protein
MNAHVIAAIFRRNFVSYFSNPTGYVFICVFVLLGSFAAFWPDEFFNTNLANLDQLNKWFPYIMLVFIPAITMSIWADEKRQGTDELLLTIPAGDLDVVLGKYLAAVAIYSVALLFSLVCNLTVLYTLGQPDHFLFLGTYFGYWMVGLAMLAMGMVASFLTGNLTVAFILGVAFNAPLVFLNVVDVVAKQSTWASTAKGWSIGEEMNDFGRGVISLSSIVYFLMIALVMLYLCMVLIGRRHWLGGHNGKTLGPHYLVRTLALAVLAVGASLLAQNWNLRADATEERLNSLSSETQNMISKLDPQHPVVIEAYISPNLPEEFVQTRIDLINLLREFQKLSPTNIQTKINDQVEPLTDEATRAEQQFDLQPQEVVSMYHGVWKQDKIFLGAAMTCGLEKITIPFFERGVPVEYELARSIATITQQKRKRVGVLHTGLDLFGGIDFAGGRPRQRPKEPLITELEKQYDVVQVDPTNPITERYDVLLAVQPSSLGPQQLANFIDAVKSGQPTAIFEDPLPANAGVAGTGQPQQQASPFQPAPPKSNINQLWDVLGVELLQKSHRGFGDLLDTDYGIVWQDFKPRRFEGIGRITSEWVFVQHDAPGGNESFNENDPTSSGLQQLLMLFPGGLVKRNAASTSFTPLVKTGTNAGVIMVRDVASAQNELDIKNREGGPTRDAPYTLAARITGKPRADDDAETPAKKADKKDGKQADKKGDDAAKQDGINVILVADVDMLLSDFFNLRAHRTSESDEFDEDNVTFVLNVLDSLADDNRFVELRKRRPKHRPLTTIVERTEDARNKAETAVNQFNQKCEEQVSKWEEEHKDYQGSAQSLQSQLMGLIREGKEVPPELRQKIIETQAKLQDEEARNEARIEQARHQAQLEIKQAYSDLNSQVRSVQDGYKLRSVILPPIPPLLVAFFVYFHRRSKEREGVSKARLR